jgi:NADP-dependent 3-hydroxy acid dehydrogenase YdfG
MANVNILGLIYCSHAGLALMAEQQSGHIVNISSVAGRIARAGSAVYNFTKWGVTGFSEALRQEAAYVNVRVTCIEPGFVDTELQGHNTHPMVVEATKKMRDEIGKVLEAEDIADAILYAVSRPEHMAINEVLVRPTKQTR